MCTVKRLVMLQLLFSFQKPFINISAAALSNFVGSTEKVSVPEKRAGRKFPLVVSPRAVGLSEGSSLIRLERKNHESNKNKLHP